MEYKDIQTLRWMRSYELDSHYRANLDRQETEKILQRSSRKLQLIQDQILTKHKKEFSEIKVIASSLLPIMRDMYLQTTDETKKSARIALKDLEDIANGVLDTYALVGSIVGVVDAIGYVTIRPFSISQIPPEQYKIVNNYKSFVKIAANLEKQIRHIDLYEYIQYKIVFCSAIKSLSRSPSTVV